MFQHYEPATITQLNEYLQRFINNEAQFHNIWIKGEIGNYTNRGHVWLSLKDGTAEMPAVIWSSVFNALPYRDFHSGQSVLVRGTISFYKGNGKVQLVINSIEEIGLGRLYLQLAAWKKHYAEIGYFDIKHKQPIPKFPTKIGIVTAAKGAVIEDIKETIKKRWPIARFMHIDSKVQGTGASKDIAAAIDCFNLQKIKPDLIIVGRGGGSMEDLWCYNEPPVIESIFKSKIPIITGIGHATDESIANSVADQWGETPTAAAKLAVPDYVELKEKLSVTRSVINNQIEALFNLYKMRFKNTTLGFQSSLNNFQHKQVRMIDGYKERIYSTIGILTMQYRQKFTTQQQTIVDKIEKYFYNLKQTILHYQYRFTDQLKTLQYKVEIQKKDIQNYKQNLNASISKYFLLKRANLTVIKKQLMSEDPTKAYKRGFYLIYDADDDVVTNINEVKINNELVIKNHQGTIYTTVKKVKIES